MNANWPTVGVLGLGFIGGRIARQLVEAGVETAGWDIRRQPRGDAERHGVAVATSGRELAARSEVILSSLPGPPESREALLDADHGAIHVMKPGSLLIDMTTNSPHQGQELLDACAERGIRFVDAPVSGTPPSMTVMVGATESSLGVGVELLDVLAQRVVHFDVPLAGYRAKILHQYMFLANLFVAAESLTTAHRFGIDPSAFAGVAMTGSAFSRALTLLPHVQHWGVERTWSAPVSLLLKDMRLVDEMAGDESLAYQQQITWMLERTAEKLGPDAPLHRVAEVFSADS